MKTSENAFKETDLQNRDNQGQDKALYAKKVRALHRQIVPGILPAFFCAVFYALMVWETHSQRNILIWLLIQLTVLSGRAYLQRYYEQRFGEIPNAQRWRTQFTLLAYLSTATWGSVAIFLFPTQDPALQILSILLIGVIAMETVGIYAIFSEITGFIVFSVSPFIVRYVVFQDDPVSPLIIFFSMSYMALVIATTRRIQKSVTRALILAEDLKREVGERQKAEAALKAAHDVLDLRVRERTAELSTANDQLRKLTNTIEQAAEMVVITDLRGRIEYLNPAVEKTTGYAPRELLGQPFQIFQEAGKSTKLLKDIAQILRTEKHWEGEILNTKKSGASYLADVTMSTVHDDRGQLTHFTAVMRDVTDRKKLEQDLLQASKLSSLGTFVSGIAHELNTPLATILGFSEEIVKENTLSPDSKNQLDWITRESKRCATIVRQLLKFSHPYKAKTSIFNLNEAVAMVLPFCQYQLQSDFIEVETDLKEAPLPVNGDQEQLQQVVLNILQNAHQAIKRQSGSGIIRVKTEQQGSDACISISNSGPAIPPDVLEKIFDPFFTTKDVGEGTGLGLSLSYGIMKEHQGQIQVENIEEGGVRFLISIPLADTAQAERHEKESQDEEELKTMLPVGLRILIVEDDAGFGEWLALCLEREAALVIKTVNGLEAIDCLKRRRFDLIISDLKMPAMNGIELCQWLEKNRPEDVKRFVLLAGVSDTAKDDFCQSRGVPVLLKPVDKKALIQTLCKVVERTYA